ncbi:unnamed protein product, partial [Aureobasidium vineae]
ALERLESTWYIEIIFLLCSVICATLIVTFLAVHNNTPIESWHFYFSINTVVSTLGVVFKSTLLMAVSAALAQGKWTWFRKRSGTLSTFEAIDAGSRDTLESFRLLWRMRGQHLVSAGALVVALGFMIEPFLQAIISDYGRLVDTESTNTNGMSATVGRSSRFDGGTQCISTYKSRYPQVDTTPDFAISASLYDGLNTATSHGYQNVSFTCMYGNCTWSGYISLAVRSTCFDISSHLKRTTQDNSTERIKSSTRSLSPGSTDISTSDTDTEMAMYPTAALSAFSGVSTLNSMAASIRSIVTSATTGLEKRASPTVQPKSVASSDPSTRWTDWTLEHLDLTLSNTNGMWRNASTFAVLQAAVVADPNLTINFKTSQALLAAFTVIRTDDSQTLGSPAWDAAGASAMECGLELTLNLYNSSVVNNVLVEHILASASQKVPESWLPSPNVDQSNVHPNGLPVDLGTKEWNPIYHDTFLYRDDYALDPATLPINKTQRFSITQRTLLSTVDFLTSLIRQNNDNATVKAVTQDVGTIFFILSIIDAHKVHVPTWKANSIATMIHGPDEMLQRDLRIKNHVHSLGVASETVAKLEWFPEGYALTAGHQPPAKISRPTTPVRDEEEHEMNALRIPTTPQTPGSNVTLVEPQVVGEAEQGTIRPVSPAFTGPDWSDVQINDPSESTPLGIRRSL